MSRLTIAFGLCAVTLWASRPGAIGSPTDYDTTEVRLTIEQFSDVQVGPEIYQWGQGHRPAGEPNYALDGTGADFVGGTVRDLWVGSYVRKFANGAVARTDLTVYCNTRTKVRVVRCITTSASGGWSPMRHSRFGDGANPRPTATLRPASPTDDSYRHPVTMFALTAAAECGIGLVTASPPRPPPAYLVPILPGSALRLAVT